MKNKILTIATLLIVIACVGVGGFFIYKNFAVNADVEGKPETDLNNDGQTNSQDLNALLKAVDDKSENPKFDVNKDGAVDSSDVDTLIKNWSSPTATK